MTDEEIKIQYFDKYNLYKYDYILDILKPVQVKNLIDCINNIFTPEQREECFKRWKERYCVLEEKDMEQFNNLRSKEIKGRYFKSKVINTKLIVVKCKLPFFGKVIEEECKSFIWNSMTKFELLNALKEYDISL